MYSVLPVAMPHFSFSDKKKNQKNKLESDR